MIDVQEMRAETSRRNLNREGIPMYLALVGAAPAPLGDPRRDEGRRLAEMLVGVHAQLAAVPEAELDDVGGQAVDEAVPEEDVTHEDLLLAEAISIVAYGEFSPWAEDLLPTAVSTPLGRTVLTPRLLLMVRALEEGRYVRVVNYHNTPAGALERMRVELAAYAERFGAVGIADVERLFSTGEWPYPRPPLMPVFYEGYRNNFEVAAPVCEAVRLTGWFFVVTGFVDTPHDEQVAYAKAHHIGLVDEELHRDRIAMTWDEVGDLAARHVVNSHTANHQPRSAVRTREEFEREVIEPTEKIRHATGRASPCHAWLFGSEFGRSPEHDIALRNAGYKWCFANTTIGALAQAGL